MDLIQNIDETGPLERELVLHLSLLDNKSLLKIVMPNYLDHTVPLKILKVLHPLNIIRCLDQ